MPRTVEAFAPAKVNLALHVTGQRADGYHTLDSLVAFVGVGDRLTVSASGRASLTVTGPMAQGVPVGPENLVRRAAGLFPTKVDLAITLEKQLPAAAGIGGGSSDAAACLLAVAHLTGRPLPRTEAILTLGADVPVCLSHGPQRMAGIGEILSSAPILPPLWAVLVNPRRPVPTPRIFAGLRQKDNPPLPSSLPALGTPQDFCDWLAAQRNDLQPAAVAMEPDIGSCLAALSGTQGCLIARMSGSGATCFGLYAAEADAIAAKAALSHAQAGWWCAAGPLLRDGDPLTTRAGLS